MRTLIALQRTIPKHPAPIGRYFSSSAIARKVFEEGDYALLRQKQDPSHDGVLVRLRRGNVLHTHRGPIQHDDVIGKRLRQVVRAGKGSDYRIHDPTLAEYVRLTPRIVTPIYPGDANIIVSLLDIHVDTPSRTPSGAPALEMLEAGTGHGALTLHLARAIHAANPPIPKAPTYAGVSTTEDAQEDPEYLGEALSDLQESNTQAWKSQRRAILHTLDIKSKHSKHAKKIVEGFRHGMYAGNVDFHVGDVSSWIASQKEQRKTSDPFLQYVFLDLPNADTHLENVASVLRTDGLLAVFNPSITQIAECVDKIREKRLPYHLDQVIELGAGLMRKWDVRSTRPKVALKKIQEAQASSDESVGEVASESSSESDSGQIMRDQELAEAVENKEAEEKWVMICRPKVGEMVVGGGFLALWRKMEPAALPTETSTSTVLGS